VLYLAALAGVRHNPWLRAFDERLRAAGKPPKVGWRPACARCWCWPMPWCGLDSPGTPHGPPRPRRRL